MTRHRVRRMPASRNADIISDEIVEPVLARSKILYPDPLRRVTARVEVDGKMREMGTLVHLLLRFMRHVAGWELSFSRLAGVARAAVWVKRDLVAILKTYGTAPRPKPGDPREKPPPLQVFFDFWRIDYGTAGPKTQQKLETANLAGKTSNPNPQNGQRKPKQISMGKGQMRRLWDASGLFLFKLKIGERPREPHRRGERPREPHRRASVPASRTGGRASPRAAQEGRAPRMIPARVEQMCAPGPPLLARGAHELLGNAGQPMAASASLAVSGGVNWQALEDKVLECLRVGHYSYRTEQTYLGWIRRFVIFHQVRKPSTLAAKDVHAFLRHLAMDEQVASSTQNQALNAMHLLEAGQDICTVQALLGHSNVETTMIYTHVLNKRPMSVVSPVDTL